MRGERTRGRSCADAEGRAGSAMAAAAACGGEVAARPPLAFSPHDRRFLAVSGSDGRLRVWDTVGSRLQHEYVPSAHLSAACTCLAWAPPGGRPPPDKVRAVGGGERGSAGGALVPRAAWRCGRAASPRPPGAMRRGPAAPTGPARPHATCGAAARGCSSGGKAHLMAGSAALRIFLSLFLF